MHATVQDGPDLIQRIVTVIVSASRPDIVNVFGRALTAWTAEVDGTGHGDGGRPARLQSPRRARSRCIYYLLASYLPWADVTTLR